jgi:hypothetical protein
MPTTRPKPHAPVHMPFQQVARTLPAGVHNRLHARPCITPARCVGREGTAPLKIGDTTDGDGRCDTFSATVLLTQSTSRTQLLAPSGPYPQPHHNVQYHVLSRNPAGLCCRALPMWPLCVGRPHRAHLMHTSHTQPLAPSGPNPQPHDNVQYHVLSRRLVL